MSAFTALQPDGWKRPSGYSHGMAAAGRIIVTAGQIGWDPFSCEFRSDDFAEQAAQALRNIAAILRTAGAEPASIVRLTWFITDREEYLAARKALGAAYREMMGAHFPAMSVVIVKGLLEPRAKVEIEATAVMPVP